MLRFAAGLTGIVVLCLASIPTPAQAGIIHLYDFEIGLNDLYGGPTLVSEGGTVSGGSYNFAPNQGLMLSNGLASAGTYTIVMDFQFSAVSGWRRIVDFKDLSTDFGLYVVDGSLRNYSLSNGFGADPIAPDTPLRLTLTRDGATQIVTGYVNGNAQWAVGDAFGGAVFDKPNNLMRLFHDDGAEASAGSISLLAIYDSPMTASEVQQLGGPGAFNLSFVPEPSSMVLLGTGLAWAACIRRRRSRKQHLASPDKK